jgi:hypothetical protein
LTFEKQALRSSLNVIFYGNVFDGRPGFPISKVDGHWTNPRDIQPHYFLFEWKIESTKDPSACEPRRRDDGSESAEVTFIFSAV